MLYGRPQSKSTSMSAHLCIYDRLPEVIANLPPHPNCGTQARHTHCVCTSITESGAVLFPFRYPCECWRSSRYTREGDDCVPGRQCVSQAQCNISAVPYVRGVVSYDLYEVPDVPDLNVS